MVGPVKIRLSARGVPQGPLSHEPKAVPMTVPPWLKFGSSGPGRARITVLEFTASARASPFDKLS
jgi:hypothetical protein